MRDRVNALPSKICKNSLKFVLSRAVVCMQKALFPPYPRQSKKACGADTQLWNLSPRIYRRINHEEHKSRGAAEAFIRVIYADKSEGEELLLLSRRDCGNHDRSSRVNGRRQVKVATRASKAASSSSCS